MSDRRHRTPAPAPARNWLAEFTDEVPCGLLAYAADGKVVGANGTLLAWTGYARDQVVGRKSFVDLLSAGSRIYHETHYAPLLRMQREVQEIAFTMLAADGSRLPVLVNSRRVDDERGGLVLTSVFKATDRRRYEQELLVARRHAEEATARLRLMQAVADELAAAGDLAEVSQVLVRAATEALRATSSVLWLRDDGAHVLSPTAASGLGPASAPLPDLPLSAAPAGDARLLAGEVVTVGLADGARQCPLVTGALRGDGSGVLVLAPLARQRRLLGLLACRFPGGEALSGSRLELVTTLVAQGGLAVPRARVFQQQRDVAQALQRSLLPAELPAHDAFTLATTYRPARDGPAVGGDWYDAFWLDGEQLAMVVGDVVGRGVNAAAAMGQLRSAVRALASVAPGPVAVLDGLDDFVDGVPAASSATTVYAVLHVPTGRLRYACAGHPPPVLLGPGGDASVLWEGRSTPLGVRFPGSREEGEVLLEPGSRLLLYTDGLVERRDRALDARIEELAEQVARRARTPPSAMVDALADAMVDTAGAPDDVCLLCLSVGVRA